MENEVGPFQLLRVCFPQKTVLFLSAYPLYHVLVGFVCRGSPDSVASQRKPDFSRPGSGLQLALPMAPSSEQDQEAQSSFTSHCPAGRPGCSFLTGPLSPPPSSSSLSPHVALSPLPLCLLFSEVSLQSKVVTLNSCFSNRPHVTGYLLIGGFP